MRYLNAHLSPLFVGTLIDMVLLGILVIQVCIYVERSWQEDTGWIKLMIFSLLIVEMAKSVFNAIFLYDHVVTHFGNYAVIFSSSWKINLDYVMMAITSCICQSFFGWRAKRLSLPDTFFNSLLVLIPIQSLMGFAIATAATALRVPDTVNHFRAAVIVWFSFSSIINIVLAMTSLWYLTSRHSGLILPNVAMPWKVAKLSIVSGSVIAAWSTIDLILYLIFDNSIHLAFNLSLGKIYTNSLIGALNIRYQCKLKTGNDTQLPLQKVTTVGGSNIRMPTRPQRVIWASKGDEASNQPREYLHFGLDVPPESGILVTSSTIVHRDRTSEGEDRSDAQVSEDPHLTAHCDFVSPSSSRLVYPIPVQSTSE